MTCQYILGVKSDYSTATNPKLTKWTPLGCSQRRLWHSVGHRSIPDGTWFKAIHCNDLVGDADVNAEYNILFIWPMRKYIAYFWIQSYCPCLHAVRCVHNREWSLRFDHPGRGIGTKNMWVGQCFPPNDLVVWFRYRTWIVMFHMICILLPSSWGLNGIL